MNETNPRLVFFLGVFWCVWVYTSPLSEVTESDNWS
jgi:hypothetical protein